MNRIEFDKKGEGANSLLLLAHLMLRGVKSYIYIYRRLWRTKRNLWITRKREKERVRERKHYERDGREK